MSASVLTARDKLRGKWVFVGITALVLLGILPVLLDEFVSVYFLRGSLRFRTIFDHNDRLWLLRTLYNTTLSVALPTVITAFLTALPFLTYLLEGHKLRRGTALVSLTMVLLPLWSLLLFNRHLYIYPIGVVITDWLGIFPNWWSVAALAVLVLSMAACLAAALALALIPKVGRFVSAAFVAIGALLTILVTVMTFFTWVESFIGGNMDLDSLMTAALRSNSVFTYAIPCLTTVGLSAVIFVFLLVNRVPALTEKTVVTTAVPAPAQEIETRPTESEKVEAKVTATPELVDEEPTAVEKPSIAKESPVASSEIGEADNDMLTLYKLRASGEISAEEYRRLRDLLSNDQND